MSLRSSANRCFVCGPGNPWGLQVGFRLEGEVCRAEFTPNDQCVGYEGVTHGGILFSLLDDVMANWVFLQGERCSTARADIRYRQPLPVGVSIDLEGRLLRRRGPVAMLEGKAIRHDNGTLVAEAAGSFIVEDWTSGGGEEV